MTPRQLAALVGHLTETKPVTAPQAAPPPREAAPTPAELAVMSPQELRAYAAANWGSHLDTSGVWPTLTGLSGAFGLGDDAA